MPTLPAPDDLQPLTTGSARPRVCRHAQWLLSGLLAASLAGQVAAQSPSAGNALPARAAAMTTKALPASALPPAPVLPSLPATPWMAHAAQATARPAQGQALTAEQRQRQHERELQAIRQALLETTLQGPTRVMSAAWIDDSGTLRELSHFNSESRVEGVRVLGYVQDDESEEPVVSAEVLPWGWPRQDGARCQPAPRQWRLPLQLNSQLEGGLTGPQQWAAQTLLQGARAQWQQLLAPAARWQALDAAPAAGNAYEKALTGTGQSAEGWHLTLRLGPAPDAAWEALNPVERYQRRGHWAFRLSLQMQDRTAALATSAMTNTGLQGLQMSQDFWIDPQSLHGPGARAEAQALLSRLQMRLTQWAERLQAHFDCEAVRYTVQHEGSRKLVLQAGAGSGLRPGDRVLVLDPARIPSQMLEPAALSHLALAEVVRVHRHQTELQQLAGPALPAASTWVALPL